MLYRQQVANGDFLEVPGTVVQCSPKVTGLAYQRLSGGNVRVRDPFIGLTGVNIASGTDVAPNTVIKLNVGRAVPATTTSTSTTTTTIPDTTTTVGGP